MKEFSDICRYLSVKISEEIEAKLRLKNYTLEGLILEEKYENIIKVATDNYFNICKVVWQNLKYCINVNDSWFRNELHRLATVFGCMEISSLGASFRNIVFPQIKIYCEIFEEVCRSLQRHLPKTDQSFQNNLCRLSIILD